MKLTPWFDHTTNPVHMGWYEVEVTEDSHVKPVPGKCMWFSGHGWYLGTAMECGARSEIVLQNGDKWRGRFYGNSKDSQ